MKFGRRMIGLRRRLGYIFAIALVATVAALPPLAQEP